MKSYAIASILIIASLNCPSRAAEKKGGDWHRPDYVCRRALTVPAPEADGPRAEWGTAAFTVDGLLSQYGMDLRVLDASGKDVPIHIVDSSPWTTATIWFKVDAKTRDYTVYYGNPMATPGAHIRMPGTTLQKSPKTAAAIGPAHYRDGDAAAAYSAFAKSLKASLAEIGKTADSINAALYLFYAEAMPRLKPGTVPPAWLKLVDDFEAANWSKEYRAYGGDPSHRNRSDINVVLPFEPDGRLYAGNNFEPGTQPIMVDGNLLAGTNYGHLWSFGKRKWQAKYVNPIASTPACIAGRAVFGTHNNTIVAVNLTNSRQIWKQATGYVVRSSPAIWRGRVYVGCSDNRLYCLSLGTGKILWTFDTQGWIEASPAIADGTVYVGSYDHYFYAINADTGKIRWKIKTGYDCVSSPVIHGPDVLFASDDGDLYCVKRADGKIRWRYTIGQHSSGMPVIRGDTIFVPAIYGHVTAIGLADGKKRWQTKGLGELEHPLFAAGNVLLLNSRDGHVYALDYETGKVTHKVYTREWKRGLEGWLYDYPGSGPVVVSSGLYVLIGGGWHNHLDFFGHGLAYRFKVKK